MKIIQDQIPPHLPDNTYVAMDTEWFGMIKSRMHRPHTGTFACLTICYQIGEVYLIRDRDLVWKAMEQLENCVWIFHNAKFDLTHLRRLATIPVRGKIIDTMAIEKILWNGYYDADSLGLDDLARRYLHIHLDKSLQEKWQTSIEMTPEMIDYSVLDADITLRVWNEQKKHITKSDMKIYREIDLPTMWAVMDMRGFALDRDGWESLAEDNGFHSKRLEEQLDFNPRSKVQVVSKLQERGFKNIPDSKAETLEKFIEKFPRTEAARQAEIILECKEFGTFASKYGKRWLEDYLEMFPDGSYGFVADYWVVGAETGRMSVRKPPLQQIPTRATKVFREKFIARPGCKLIIGDYSQQEVMIMAYVTQDPTMMEICNSGRDIYIMMAKIMHNVDIGKSDPMRKRMKAIVLGLDYGMSEYGLSRKEDISLREAVETILLFRKKFPKVSDYLDRMEKEKSMVKTVSGRKYWLNPYSSQCPRNAMNAPIQGTAADIMKLAVAQMHQDWMWPCEFGLVNVIHDEAVLDVREQFAPEVKDFVVSRMVSAAKQICPGMKFRVDAIIADNWAEKE